MLTSVTKLTLQCPQMEHCTVLENMPCVVRR